MRAGDICVQRDTMHAWVAKGSEPAVFAFVLIDLTVSRRWVYRGRCGVLSNNRALHPDFRPAACDAGGDLSETGGSAQPVGPQPSREQIGETKRCNKMYFFVAF